MALANLTARVRIEGIGTARTEMAGLRRETMATAESIGGAASKFSALASSLLATASAAGAVKVATTAWEAAADYDSMVRSLGTVATSVDDLRARLIRYQDIAKLPGLGMNEVTKAAVALEGAGVSTGLAERAIRAFGNAAAASGAKVEDTSEALRQLSQIASAGKLSGEELNVIGERITVLGPKLRQAFGGQTTEQINKTGLSTEQLMEKLVRAAETVSKASGGIRNDAENLRMDLESKVTQPLGRAFASLSGPAAQAISRLLDRMAPGMERLARAAEAFARSPFAQRLAEAAFSMKTIVGVASAVGGILAGMATTQVINGIIALVGAFQKLRVAIQEVGVVAAVMQSIVTQGKALGPIIAGAAAGIATGVGINYALNKTFAAGAAPGPYVPPDLQTSGGKKGGGLIDTLNSLGIVTILNAMSYEKDRQNGMERIMAQVERHLAKMVDIMDLRRMALGGGELGQIGVTQAELKGRNSGMYAAPRDYSRPAASQLQSAVENIVTQRMRRSGVGLPQPR